MSVSTLIPVSIYFEITLDKTFHVKSIEKKTGLINTSNHKELYFDYKTLDSKGWIDVLPNFSSNTFQLDNDKAVNQIQFNDKTGTLRVSYINQSRGFITEHIERKINKRTTIELLVQLEEVLNEIINAKD